MQEESAPAGVTLQITYGCLVVTIQVEISDEAMLEIQTEILEKVSQTGVKGVIIDLAGVDILDSFLAQAFLDTGRMASLLGASTVIVGIKPELVSALIDLGLEFKDILTAMTLEQGFQKLRPIAKPEEETAKETSGDFEVEPAERDRPDDDAADEPEEESQEESLADDEA